MSEEKIISDKDLLDYGERYRWDRPELPKLHKGVGVIWGNILIVLGFALMVLLPLMDQGLTLMMLDGIIRTGMGLMALGIVITAVSLILREIRHGNFEAAIRAGEARPLSPPR